MAYQGSKVYDDEDFFKKYIEKRRRKNSPNEILEEPIIEELLESIKDKKLLDIGCGDGLYGKDLLERGLKFYHGIDSSEKMIKLAKSNLQGFNNIKLELNEIEKLNLEEGSYDIILSRLVFHYIENLTEIFKAIQISLRSEGCFIFSIEHPIITSNYESYHKKSKTKREDWIVDNYFESGIRINKWIDKEVVKYHRTIEEYIKLIKESEFEIKEIRESKPKRVNFEDQEEFKRRMRIPLFMIFKLKKPAGNIAYTQ